MEMEIEGFAPPRPFTAAADLERITKHPTAYDAEILLGKPPCRQ